MDTMEAPKNTLATPLKKAGRGSPSGFFANDAFGSIRPKDQCSRSMPHPSNMNMMAKPYQSVYTT